MEPTQVKQLFIDLFGKKIDVYGLSVVLSNVEFIETLNIYEFNFNIINPYNVSYYITPVEWGIQELIDEFINYVDVRINSNIFLNTKQSELYFNQEKTKEIENTFKQVDTIKFTTGTPFIGYNRYEIKIKSFGYKKGFAHEQIWLENVIKPISATKNGDPCDIDEVIIQYYEEFLPAVETYWESEHIYQHLDQVLSSIPSIGNNDILLAYSTTLSRK
jgi:hypothetical protein